MLAHRRQAAQTPASVDRSCPVTKRYAAAATDTFLFQTNLELFLIFGIVDEHSGLDASRPRGRALDLVLTRAQTLYEQWRF
jgi:hypothetical protein